MSNTVKVNNQVNPSNWATRLDGPTKDASPLGEGEDLGANDTPQFKPERFKEQVTHPILRSRVEIVLEGKNYVGDKEPYCRDFDKGSFGPFDKGFDKTCPK